MGQRIDDINEEEMRRMVQRHNDIYKRLENVENRIEKLEKKLKEVEVAANHRHHYISPPVYG